MGGAVKAKVKDYISGKEVTSTPEEVDAVQPFSKKLVEDYGYPPSHIQTRKQFRVKASPSDTQGYPVDIAVFSSEQHSEDTVYIIVECKASTKNDGRRQLEHYLKFSNASMGVWYNGSDFLALRKHEQSGQITFKKIPDIPKFGERLEDIGQYRRKDLRAPHNLTAEFRTIRNYLAGNAHRIVNDQQLSQELINMILCKLYDEKYTPDNESVQFRVGVDEPDNDVYARIIQRFNDTKEEYSDVFGGDEKISLDPASVSYVVGRLQPFSLIRAERDVVADAFEVFIGPSLRGEQGQFFTPRNVVKAVIDIVKPKSTEKVIDPACGSGGFLVECLRHMHEQIDAEGAKYGWNREEIKTQKIQRAQKHIRGIEKDALLSKIIKSYMIILGDGRSGIVTEDALDPPGQWRMESQSLIEMGKYDVVVTNPPFGAKIPIKGKERLSQFELGHKWVKEKGGWTKGGLREEQAPQILFIDRCLELLKEGGRLGIVLPDGILSNPTYEYIRQSLLSRAEIIGVVDVPADAFRPSTNTKTHLLFLKKTSSPRADYNLFMSYALTCGHDKRRRPISSDDMGDIPRFLEKLEKKKCKPSNLGMFIALSDVQNNVWLPKFHNLNTVNDLQRYKQEGHAVISIGELVDQKVVELVGSGGGAVESDYYGEGTVPFIRTSDIDNWEVSEGPTHCVSEEVYNQVKDGQDVRKDDILMVKDGTFLIGKTAIITSLDTKIVLQSHFMRLRVIDKGKMSPHLLLGLLNTEVVRKQFDSNVFTQSSISTIGKRIRELTLVMPKSAKEAARLTETVEQIVENKYNAKRLSRARFLGKDQSFLGFKNNGHQGNL